MHKTLIDVIKGVQTALLFSRNKPWPSCGFVMLFSKQRSIFQRVYFLFLKITGTSESTDELQPRFRPMLVTRSYESINLTYVYSV